MKSEIDNAANGYLHKWDVNGVPTTSFTWDDMVECFKYAVEWKGKQMEKEQQEAPAELDEAAAAAMPKPNGIDSKADFSFFQMLNMFKAGAEWDRAKMMENAVEGEIMTNGFYPYEPRVVASFPNCPYNFGDKVKVIVIPTEE